MEGKRLKNCSQKARDEADMTSAAYRWRFCEKGQSDRVSCVGECIVYKINKVRCVMLTLKILEEGDR